MAEPEDPLSPVVHPDLGAKAPPIATALGAGGPIGAPPAMFLQDGKWLPAHRRKHSPTAPQQRTADATHTSLRSQLREEGPARLGCRVLPRSACGVTGPCPATHRHPPFAQPQANESGQIPATAAISSNSQKMSCSRCSTSARPRGARAGSSCPSAGERRGMQQPPVLPLRVSCLSFPACFPEQRGIHVPATPPNPANARSSPDLSSSSGAGSPEARRGGR